MHADSGLNTRQAVQQQQQKGRAYGVAPEAKGSTLKIVCVGGGGGGRHRVASLCAVIMDGPFSRNARPQYTYLLWADL